jgi:hypothetical protein
MLRTTDLQDMKGKEALVGAAELVPGVAAGKHNQHGDDLGYILKGTAVLEVISNPGVCGIIRPWLVQEKEETSYGVARTEPATMGGDACPSS